MVKPRWPLALVLVLALTPACGGDDDDDGNDATTETTGADTPSGDDDYVEAMVASMASSDNAFDDAETNECVARALIDGIGLENLEGKVTPTELAEAGQLSDVGVTVDGDAVWVRANECTDVGLWLMDSTAGGDATIVECLMNATTEQERQALFVSSLEGADTPEAAAATTAVGAAFQVCAPTG